MCMGYWTTMFIVYLTGFSVLNAILYAAVGSLTAELTDRKLWSGN
jgi:hypothetical protein